MPILLQVALGGAIGASLRYLSGTMILRTMGGDFPYGTMFVNILGSFLMGFLAIYLLERMDGRYTPLLMTGILGGFTTFSAYSLDALYLLERGRYVSASVYMGGSVLLAIGALILGMTIARSLT
ncbi:MAG: fluoride efflux transporter CrcB [Paracoccaceae bacterium]